MGQAFCSPPLLLWRGRSVSRGEASSAGGRCPQLVVVCCQSCDPRLPHSSDILRSGENTRKMSSQTLIEKAKQKSVALIVMAFVTKMDCSVFKISRVTCLQETQVFGQEDAPGLYGKQSKAGLFFSSKVHIQGGISVLSVHLPFKICASLLCVCQYTHMFSSFSLGTRCFLLWDSAPSSRQTGR